MVCTDPTGIGCYAAADLDAKTVVVGADGRATFAAYEAVSAADAFGPGEMLPLADVRGHDGCGPRLPGGPQAYASLSWRSGRAKGVSRARIPPSPE